MNRIKCSVSSCKYNEVGEVCNADEIKVRNNLKVTNNMEFGSLDNNSSAKTSMETCCETFTPKKDSSKV